MANGPTLAGLRRSIPSSKIEAYLLDVTHPKGGPKARFFLSFGFVAERPDHFARALLSHVTDDTFVRTQRGAWGTKYIFEGPLPTPDRRNPVVRSIWLMRTVSRDELELVTAYPLP